MKEPPESGGFLFASGTVDPSELSEVEKSRTIIGCGGIVDPVEVAQMYLPMVDFDLGSPSPSVPSDPLESGGIVAPFAGIPSVASGIRESEIVAAIV